MNEILDTIIKSCTLMLVAISTGLAIRIYYRNKRIELENSLFKSRLDAIGNIQMEMNIFFQHLDRIKVYLDNPEYLKDKDSGELAFAADDQLYKCQASIMKYAVYFTPSATKNLELFVENFLGDMLTEFDKPIINLLEFERVQLNIADKAISDLRKEAGIEDIHFSLMKRFQRSKSVFSF